MSSVSHCVDERFASVLILSQSDFIIAARGALSRSMYCGLIVLAQTAVFSGRAHSTTAGDSDLRELTLEDVPALFERDL